MPSRALIGGLSFMDVLGENSWGLIRDKTSIQSKINTPRFSSFGSFRGSNIEFLEHYMREVEPLDFYAHVFGTALDITDEYTKGGYTAIVHEVNLNVPRDEHGHVKRYTVTDGLSELHSLISCSPNFCIMSPVTYCGKQARAQNARFLCAMCIEIDYLQYDEQLKKPNGLIDFLHQIVHEHLPVPSYVVHSGNGIHVYYIFDEPIPLYKNNVKRLKSLRRKLTKLLWNQFITEASVDPHNQHLHKGRRTIQYESLYQQFRVVGTNTKKMDGTKTRAFMFGNGDTVSAEYLASFIDDDPSKYLEIKQAPKRTRKELEEQFPDWYHRTFTEKGNKRKKPIKKHWTFNRAVYDNYLKRISAEVEEGHRYYALLHLVSCAKKCGISREEVTQDCLNLLEPYEELTEREDNHFTQYDVDCALANFDREEMYYHNLAILEERVGINFPRTKRNFRKQENHLKGMRALQEINDPMGNWRKGNGRKPKKEVVQAWRKENPNGTKYKCAQETGLDKKTVRKWWES